MIKLNKWVHNTVKPRDLASILENWRQKIKIGDFFGSNIFGARATPDRPLLKSLGSRMD
jgi:hypothetical protein